MVIDKVGDKYEKNGLGISIRTRKEMRLCVNSGIDKNRF